MTPHRHRSFYCLLLAVVSVLLASGCSTDTTELDAAVAAGEARVSELESAIGTKEAELVSLQAELDEAMTVNAEQADSVAELESELAGTQEALAASEAAVQELRVRFDPEIRAAAQAAWDAELARACAEAGGTTTPIAGAVRYSDDLEVIGPEQALVDAVTACAEPLRNRSEEDRLNAECAPGDVDAVIRDTDGFVGQCLVMFVIPFQWDSRTGECNFLGSWDPENLGVTYSYRYDGDGVFRAGTTLCADGLADADQDDLLKVWVNVTGTFAYDTAAGGTNEIPDFELRKVELIAKD